MPSVVNNMSRVGKKPILIPEGIQVKVEGQKLTIKGAKGELSREIRPEIKVEVKENQIFVSREIESQKTKALWGLTRSLLNNMVKGVSSGYEKKLEIEGIGFKAAVEGGELLLNVGFSHPIKIAAPEGINFSVEKNIITVSGADKELVGQTAAIVKRAKKPDPYKGKGIRYVGEQIRRKVGKKAVVTE